MSPGGGRAERDIPVATEITHYLEFSHAILARPELFQFPAGGFGKGIALFKKHLEAFYKEHVLPGLQRELTAKQLLERLLDRGRDWVDEMVPVLVLAMGTAVEVGGVLVRFSCSCGWWK